MSAPTIYGPDGRPIRSQKKAANPVWRNHFAHGASQDSQTPYSPVRLDDIDSLIPPYDWQTLLSGSRGLYQNYGPVRGATHQKANNAVGNTYTPDFTGSDPKSVEWAKRARDWLLDWMRASNVRGAPFTFTRDLWLSSVAIDRDGDVFYLLTTHRESGLPAIQYFPANRICTGGHDSDFKPVKKGRFRGLTIVNGVIRNAQNRAIAYRVKIGDEDKPESYRDISARSLRPIYDPEWHDQGRGLPAGSHALRFVANSLQSHEWEHTALMMLSSIGLIEKNPLGMANPDDPGSTLGEADTAPTGDPGVTQKTLAGGTIRYFSSSNPNSGLETLSHDRPSEQWEAFQDRTIRFYCSGIDWPYELLWKPEGANGTTIRNIQERAQNSTRDRQEILDYHARAQTTYALAGAIRLRLLDPPPNPSDLWRWKFRHPKKISIDPGRDTKSEISAIQANHTPLRDVVESRGGTIEEHMDAIIADEIAWNAKREAAGLPPAPLTGADATTKSTGEGLVSIKEQLDAYGVAVRAGTITPQKADEDHFREMAGLPTLSLESSKLWKEQGGTRQPITLVQEGAEAKPLADTEDENEEDT